MWAKTADIQVYRFRRLVVFIVGLFSSSLITDVVNDVVRFRFSLQFRCGLRPIVY